jgi:hypothetical protein
MLKEDCVVVHTTVAECKERGWSGEEPPDGMRVEQQTYISLRVADGAVVAKHMVISDPRMHVNQSIASPSTIQRAHQSVHRARRCRT